MTLVVNFAGAPGAGKSTMCAGLYYELKSSGVDCEMAREYAKDVVWEGRHQLFDQQIYIFAKQLKMLYDLRGKTDVILTDSPLILSLVYRGQDGTLDEAFDAVVTSQYRSFNNFFVYVNRVKPYVTSGRMGTAEDSDALDRDLKQALAKHGIVVDMVVAGEPEGLHSVVRRVKGLLTKPS